jgi:hypothetical protein
LAAGTDFLEAAFSYCLFLAAMLSPTDLLTSVYAQKPTAFSDGVQGAQNT